MLESFEVDPMGSAYHLIRQQIGFVRLTPISYLFLFCLPRREDL